LGTCLQMVQRRQDCVIVLIRHLLNWIQNKERAV
jgi:hypothetical protein